MASTGPNGAGRPVAIVAGVRTPFAKIGTNFVALSALDLASTCVAELVARSGVPKSAIQRIVYGQVVPSIHVLNVAREIVFEAGLPATVDAYSIARACTTSYQTTADLAQGIASGEIDCGISGGVDSASGVPIAVSKPLAAALVKMRSARTPLARARAFSHVRPRDLLPEPPSLVERSTGLTMGQAAEKMARENRIPRGAQDELAFRSHALATTAWRDGRYAEEVMTVRAPGEGDVRVDNLVRRSAPLESYRKLRPVFDRTQGSITAANSSALTDGASAIMLMSIERAEELGVAPLAIIKSFAFSAIDPGGQMLMGPAFATPIALARAHVSFAGLDLIDIHEAFAAQVLSVTQHFEANLGPIDWDKVNVMGGSLALGHPFAATGTRQIMQLVNELRRRGGGVGLATACAAGGLGAAMVVEAA